MKNCELMCRCLFLHKQVKDIPLLQHIMQDTFCRQNKTACARYVLYRVFGFSEVIPDLFPNQMYRAKQFLDKA
ncbi:MAG: hypothetical protein JW904_09315 [Spirochaetales bacterium]|nr:hypothetical protein [Spirochaetales bacterium]